ncbi:LysR family transcriptional regulator [Kocuria varians]|uniref:LysR family transcriptional regulator n=1 Tax=Kocuria varians TaxID=1272 RepID=UPI0009EEC714|nr:LysR family transcriptional regulator [Kocuria varians]
MELRQLEYFIEVARYRSFTRAAEKLFVSQPGVSSQISQLERKLKGRLFERDSRRVRLTDLGSWLLPRAEQIVQEVADLNEQAKEYSATLSGTVRLGSVFALQPTLLPIPKLIYSFSTKFPNTTIDLVERPGPELVTAVRNGEIDLAVTGGPWVLSDEVTQETIHCARLCVVTRLDDTTGYQRPLTDLSFLHGSPILSLSSGTPVRTEIDGLLHKFGLEVRYDSPSPGNLHALVREGLGAAVLPEGLIPPDSTDLIEIPLDQSLHGDIELELLWSKRRDRKRVVECFRSTILAMIQSSSTNPRCSTLENSTSLPIA